MKLFKEKEKDIKTLAKENKRLQIFIIIFMAITICFATFYFNVICFGAECESKSPKPLIIINSNKENTDVETTQNDETKNSDNQVSSSSTYTYEDMYAVYTSEDTESYCLTLYKDGNFTYNYDGKSIKGNYELINEKVHLVYVSENSNGVTNNITGTKDFNIIDKTKLYDSENSLDLIRANIPTNPGE